MVRFADTRKKPLFVPMESVKPSRYRKEEKKVWIYAFYALMAGTQKRTLRLKNQPLPVLDFGAKERAAEEARRDLSEAERLARVKPILADSRCYAKPPEDPGAEPNADQVD